VILVNPIYTIYLTFASIITFIQRMYSPHFQPAIFI